jgi:dTDP-4-amino-4,6-dideoxy-D-galactose acyltransferase
VSLAVRRLEWDSDFFGFPVGEGHPVTRDEVAAVDAWATSERLRCVYLSVPSGQIPLLHAAESLGFRLMGVHVTSVACAPFDAASGSDRIVVRAPRSADVDVLERIAADAHPDTRFFADPGFSRDSCRRLYETWIRRSVEGWADCVLVAENRDSGVAGYITLHRRSGGARIGLIAVDGKTRGRGLGRGLVHAAFDWCERHDINRVDVTTQAQNVGALRLYLRCGFVVDRVDFWLHKWQ